MDLDIDFGNVKPLPEIPEGEYNLTIVDWNIVEAQKEETRKKGANLRIKFKFTDPAYEDKNGTVHDISAIQPNDQIFFMYDNPWTLVPLLAAIKGLDKSDPKALGSVNISDKSDWIGEQVIARLIRTEAANGRKYLNPVSEAYLPVPF